MDTPTEEEEDTQSQSQSVREVVKGSKGFC